MTLIPILNLSRQYETLKAEIEAAIVGVASSGFYILGSNVTAFENEMAQWLGVQHVVGCASGTDALYLALKALRIGADSGTNYMIDEVITTPFTYVATSEAIIQAGAKPVFVDIDPVTYNIDPAQVEAAITNKTKAILPVHLYGHPCDMNALKNISKKHGVPLIEDCAQAIGSQWNAQHIGTIGDIGCFSFFPSKNLGALGDGGMVVTNDDELAERLRMLRVHGSRHRYYHQESGLNSRLDEIQAAALRVKLKYLNGWNQKRRELAARYDQLLASFSSIITTPTVPDETVPVFHQYTIKLNLPQDIDPVQARHQIQKSLLEAGVQTMIYYPVPQYKQESHAFLKLNAEQFPVSEAISNQVLSLPMFPELTEVEQQSVVQALEKALETFTVLTC